MAPIVHKSFGKVQIYCIFGDKVTSFNYEGIIKFFGF
jgi:hypothetical protein